MPAASTMFRRGFTLIVLLGITLPAAPVSAQSATGKLERQIAAIAPFSGGTVGVAAMHLETGQTIFYNADDQFPLASTYKVPIAFQAFRLVEEGKLDLDRMVAVEPTDIHLGEEFNNLFQAAGVSLSLRNLIEPMLIFSENSATDMVLRLGGGGAAVTARLRSVGITGVRVDQSTAELIAGNYGVPDIWTDGKFSKEKWLRGSAAVSKARQDSAAWYYANDPRDHGSPRAMLTLLTRLWKGELLNREHTAYLFDIMYRCETGKARIKGMLPPGTRVAHKTGTFPGTTNDVGIIDLPDGTHLALAVYIKQSAKVEGADLEATIAQVARGVYDYFLFRNEGSLALGAPGHPLLSPPVPVYQEPRHRLVFQNGLVRVLDVLVPPGDTTGYHVHANRTIGVAVKDARIWHQALGAAPDSVELPAPVPNVFDNWGQDLPYTHRVGNADTTPFHYIVGEWLASPGTDTPPLPNDATRRLVKEGAIARIYQVTILPGAATESHTHSAPGLTVVGTTGALVEEGSTPAASGGAGAGRWNWRNAGHRHVLRNAGDTPITLFEIDWR